jgi:tetratricopeptide (TPR) repeat protein
MEFAGNRRLAFYLCLSAFFCGSPAFAQTAKPLAAEVQSLEKKLSGNPGPAEKSAAYRELAQLLELSGNYEGAARAWNEASLAPSRDYAALLRSGACYAAVGEFDKAGQAVNAVFKNTVNLPNSDLPVKARLLMAQLLALRLGEIDELRSLIAEPAFAAHKPAIYYTIWRVSGDASYKTRLLNEFPQSPEALAAKDGTAVSSASTPLWILGGASAVASSSVAPARQAQTQPSAAQTPAAQAPAAQPAVQPATPPQQPAAQTPPAASGTAAPAMLQTGLFSREANAKALADRLRDAGFSPIITTKTVNGAQYWAVGVSGEGDYNAAIMRLKDKGFEAFPVF